jgi:hypothetical protein
MITFCNVESKYYDSTIYQPIKNKIVSYKKQFKYIESTESGVSTPLVPDLALSWSSPVVLGRRRMWPSEYVVHLEHGEDEAEEAPA